ncbi:integrator complex subunit 15 [Ictalurus punctatus]|uniref:Integrator complex subunit 15 n=1 Tax=Ictalurus punctatus TaxID=7998 RepID=A0A2D0Q3V0_ICTPU|nr:integrator complex subunit 15 [Ictalurus punctatus]XP_053532046.1 integrator complex subunit 15 [Ictalurus punctatus]
MSDIRHALLRRDPLSAAKEVLYHLDIALGSTLQTGPGLDKNTVDLVEEFIFHVPKDRNTQRKRMSCVQELQLLEIMCSYFQEQSKDAVRQVIFSALFSLQGNKADENRMATLGKLVSMAVAVCRVPILECAATWLQRTHSAWCVRLALVLVDDYCTLVPGSIATLQNVSSASPRFCCQLITAVTALYDFSSDELTPPPSLLDMVVGWITEDPRLLLLTFINTPLSSSLPLGCLEATPLAGLLRWCVKAPLASQRARKSAVTGVQPEQENGAVCEELYSKLHLSVLQVFLMLQVHLTEQNLLGRLAVLQVESVAALVEEVSALVEELNPLHAANQIQLALDRLAQALQVAMATGALLCSREDLRTLCSRLPHNNMLQLVMSGPVVPHGAAFQPSVYPYIHPARPSPLSPHPSHPALSPLPAHPALTTHHQLTPHPAHSPLPPPHAFHPASMAFQYRPIR